MDEEGIRICNIIRDNTRRMGQLIDDLLAFSRLGRFELNKSWIDMNTLVHSVFNEITGNQTNERIVFNVGKLSLSFGDPNLIRQVWVNLLSNAIKYSAKKENSIINVISTTEDGMSVFSVSDNGAGFDMEYYNKLFGVFQRLHSPNDFEGTGVGLASVQRIVKRHGGEVWAEGKEGEGATFYFSLPDVNITNQV
jgi:light-regulated signal transduction histidine kinase (bacteriophytochrome)